jgi:hypothetical protein
MNKLPKKLDKFIYNSNWNKDKFNDSFMNLLPSKLKSLEIASAIITDTSLQKIPSKLTHLNISDCEQLTDKVFQFLPSTIKSLNLTNTNITDNGLKYLPTSLIHLQLSGCYYIKSPSSIKFHNQSNN